MIIEEPIVKDYKGKRPQYELELYDLSIQDTKKTYPLHHIGQGEVLHLIGLRGMIGGIFQLKQDILEMKREGVKDEDIQLRIVQRSDTVQHKTWVLSEG
jgi:ribosomal protein S28E/S33